MATGTGSIPGEAMVPAAGAFIIRPAVLIIVMYRACMKEGAGAMRLCMSCFEALLSVIASGTWPGKKRGAYLQRQAAYMNAGAAYMIQRRPHITAGSSCMDA